VKQNKHTRILVTAALPYANGYLHLGHLAGAYLPADLYARYQRSRQQDVLFLCGSDEHGVAITVTAEKEKLTPQQIIDRYHPSNKAAFNAFRMSFDHYSRTSLPLHHETAQYFFKKLFDAGLLKEKNERQLYCEKDSMFLADRYVEGTCPHCGNTEARGDQCENCGNWLSQLDLKDPKCKLCGSLPVAKETAHLYFPLGDFQKRLQDYVRERDERDHWKENVLRYCGSWFKEGLRDRAITRDLQWGVKVPAEEFSSKVMYVWFDAVLGYISSSKEWSLKRNEPERWREYWQSEQTKYVAFIGKDNVVFHCIVFPAMLMAYNDLGKDQYVLPENVPANEFLNLEGLKFSKSRGWGIDVQDFLRHFPADYLRYALAMNLPESRDSDFTLDDFRARINNELADILGNFVNRTLTFARKNFNGILPPLGSLQPIDEEIVRLLREAPGKIGKLYDSYHFRDAVIETMNVVRAANKYFNDSQPWKTIKQDPNKCATAIHICLQLIRSQAILFEPLLPDTASQLGKVFNLAPAKGDHSWDKAGELILPQGTKIGDLGIIFPKIMDEQIHKFKTDLGIEEKNTGMNTDLIQPNPDYLPLKETVGIEDFQKIDLRIAKIIEAERVPKSDKLVKLKVELGPETRQVIAGIGKQYEPADLMGRSIVLVANLKEAKLMGQISQGMLLAANDTNGVLTLIGPQGPAISGSAVK